MTYTAFKKGDKVKWFDLTATVTEDSPAESKFVNVEDGDLVGEWDKTYLDIPVVLDENA